jgi:glycosyltransferase involved in cell wall biosynthesis
VNDVDDAAQASREPERRRRLLIVSAHYPPNFISGGTLVPQRQATGFQEREWDVAVYAGHLDPTARPLSTREEVVSGVPVRWIEIEPFTGWADRRNFDNPAVLSDFAATVERLDPDVVHLHSLQTLGGGLVQAAAVGGARVVLTMHDFWWCCARQFLVDRTWVPCSLVVAAGVCACEVDPGWLSARNAWLATQLEHADLILAPSAVAADVLRANGVPADRLEVDENGLEAVPGSVAHESDFEGVTFRYVGGADRMKGSDVLRRAVLRLREEAGWQIVVHGDRDDLEALGPWPGQARLDPPFAPGGLDDVMARTDVLIVPSLMRESHSLVTREALLRGVPVICSDSLGPEAVVVPGRNGTVVPTGSSETLAEAMAQVVRDPGRLSEWAVAAKGVPVRLESERLDDLSTRLAELADAPRADRSTAGDRSIRRVVFVCGIDGAPLRYRAHLPAEGLRCHGVAAEVVHYRDPSVVGLVTAADAMVLYRVPATHQILALIERVRQERPEVPVLFDVDDLIFDPDLADEIPALRILPSDEAALWMEGVRRYRTTMEACDAFIGSTRMLCDHASAVTGMRSHLFENGVGTILAHASDQAIRRPRAGGPLRVGYFSGTTTHDHDWRYIEDAVIQVLETRPDVELVLGGHLNPTPALDRLGDRVRRQPMLDWLELPGALRDLDVNLAPLEPASRFNEAKSAIKWLEAALVATPTIASPTEPFRTAIDDGVDGLVAGTPEEWRAALDALLGDEALRGRLGAGARRSALLRWPPHLQGSRYLEILSATRADLADLRRARESGWRPVANDEPPAHSQLQGYGRRDEAAASTPASVAGAPSSGPLGPRLIAATSRRVRAAERTVRRDGWTVAGPVLAANALADARRIAARIRRALKGRL